MTTRRQGPLAARIAEWRDREARLDGSGMRGRIAGLPDDLAEGGRRAAAFVTDLPACDPPPTAIAVLGMGGSAIGGDLVAAFTAGRRRLPLYVQRDYGLPAGLDDRAVVIASSYSGNTEETLAAYEAARAAGMRAIAVTTGGRLAERARELGDPVLALPPGYPPRAALGHSFAACALVVAALDPGLDSGREAEALEEAAAALRAMAGTWLEWSAENPALALAAMFEDRFPILCAGHATAIAAARRWKAQLNENSKIPAWTSEFPEHNHNEIVGFTAGHPSLRGICIVYLETPWDHARVERRFDVVHRVLSGKVGAQRRIEAIGRSPLEGMLWLCYLGDCTSFLCSIIMGLDPTPVTAIEDLKRALEEPTW
ncbi:bifunctional phosphoglucose/phosphomannose isomerase [soil metagenome]